MELNHKFMGEILNYPEMGIESEKRIYIIDNTDISWIEYLSHGYMESSTTISIYEVMHLIKKWAYDKGYEIRSGYRGYSNLFKITPWGLDCVEQFNEKTEFEAVYQAGLWVFEKLKEQNNGTK